MRNSLIPAETFKLNRKRLALELLPGSLAILHSNDEMSRSADQNFPYHQDPDLFYLSGVKQEKTILIMFPTHPDKKLREILFIRKQDRTVEIWEGHKLTPNEAKALSGIDNIKFLDDYESTLASLMMQAQNVYLNVPEYLKFIPELPCRNLRMALELQKKFPLHNYVRLAPVLTKLRTVKSEDELKMIRNASSITRDAFLRILRFLRPGKMEYEIEAEITHEFLKQGATGHAYPPIIASGINACTLHYIENDKECRETELLLMDFGAEYGSYAADCSRTIPVNGKFTERQKLAYQSVLDVFKFARSLMIPGSSINKVHEEVCKKFEKEHIKLGLYKQSDLEENGTDFSLMQQYYMHGTSHFLGLDVHDTGTKDMEFKPGMVLTCEPGLYIVSENMGIRIENDILITENGNIDLMSDIPIEIVDIEDLMKRQ